MFLQVKVSSAKLGGKEKRETKTMASTGMAKSKGTFCITLSLQKSIIRHQKEKNKIFICFSNFAFESRRTIDHSSNSSVDPNCSRGSYIYRYSSHGLLASLRYNARMVFDPLLLIVEELLCEHKMIFVYVLWHPLIVIACGA